MEEKYNLTIKEASKYYNIGENTLRCIAKNDGSKYCFVLYVGKKVLIKKKKFEEYLNTVTHL